jgi:hypothetical protein
MKDSSLFEGNEQAKGFFDNLMQSEANTDQGEKLLYRERIFHEALPPIKELFDSLDSDSDGQLSLDELRLALAQLGISPACLGQWIQVIDSDQNKSISFEEFDVFTKLARDYIWPRDRIVLEGSSVNVFLGGSCNPTTWRQQIAIPLLERANVTYYNPQVEEWYPALVEEEARAKKNSSVLFFVIDGKTRAIGSMLEVVEYIAAKEKEVVLVICDVLPNTQITGVEVCIPTQPIVTPLIQPAPNETRHLALYSSPSAHSSHSAHSARSAVCRIMNRHQPPRPPPPPAGGGGGPVCLLATGFPYAVLCPALGVSSTSTKDHRH